MHWFREIVLQDAAVLMNNPKYASHPMFKSPLFSTPLFLSFQQQVLGATQAEKPAETLMKSVLPLVHDGLANLTQVVISENLITRAVVRDQMQTQAQYQHDLNEKVLLPTSIRLGVLEMVEPIVFIIN